MPSRLPSPKALKVCPVLICSYDEGLPTVSSLVPATRLYNHTHGTAQDVLDMLAKMIVADGSIMVPPNDAVL